HEETPKPRSNRVRTSDLPARDDGALELLRHAVRAQRGHVEVGAPTDSERGQQVRLVLPASAVSLKPKKARHPTPILSRAVVRPDREATLVWIDDDAMFVRAMGRLVDRGETLVAGDLAEAKRLLADLSSPPDLILCDIHLPDGLGTELHREMVEHEPELASRFVFITGALVSGDVARYIRASGRPTLVKPIAPEAIFDQLHRGASTMRFATTLRPD
ncbi:MAG: response regulator, partial [Myxococcota bacterium]